MLHGTYYLNNSGHRWVVYERGRKPHFYVKDANGNFHKRTAQFFEAFGNFVAYYFSWKGKRVSGLPEWCEEHEGCAVIHEKGIAYPKKKTNG